MTDEQTHNKRDRSTQVLNDLASCRGIPPQLLLEIAGFVRDGQKWRNRNGKQRVAMKLKRNSDLLANVSQREPTLANAIYKKEDTLKKEREVSKNRRATTIPLGFSPNQEWARKELGWDGAKAAEEASKFKDYAAAHSKRYSNWDAAWRNWCRSPFQKGANGNGRSRTDKEQYGDLLRGIRSERFGERLADVLRGSGASRENGVHRNGGGSVRQLPIRNREAGGSALGDTDGPSDLLADSGGDSKMVG